MTSSEDEEPDESPDQSPDGPLETVRVFGGGLSGSFELAQAVLRSAGIQFIAIEHSAIAFFPPDIRVRVEDAEEARRLLATLS